MARRTVADALADAEVAVSRREALRALGGGGLALGAGKALDNVVVGYGVLVGTNLLEQDLAALADERLAPSPFVWRFQDGRRLSYTAGRARVIDEQGRVVLDRRLTGDDTPVGTSGTVALPGEPVDELAADLPVVAAGDHRFTFHRPAAFFERLDGATHRPATVAALRGHRFGPTDAATVRRFADADPAEPWAAIRGMKAGFREHSGYDIPRYLAGSVEDNLLGGAVDLRGPFASPTDFEAILAGENTGLFCYTFAHRSIEALHASPPSHQTPPVFAGVVTDPRHKHAYTVVASAVRDEGDLVIPVTFIDYTHSTLYDDLGLRGLLGEGLAAYDARHRAGQIYWNRYARV